MTEDACAILVGVKDQLFIDLRQCKSYQSKVIVYICSARYKVLF